MSTIHNEFTEVELPFIRQLEGLGWKHIEGSKDDPAVTGREHFGQVILRDRLVAALRRINLDDEGKEWLDDGRIAQAIAALVRPGQAKLIEANRVIHELLLLGTQVEGVPSWNQGRAQTVQYIDWENPENNEFLAINQFRVDEPGGQAKKFIVPDIVLFINGIPVVVIECKNPATTEPMDEAITQLLRYSNRRRDLDLVEVNEGNERLFHANQFMIATFGDEARVGTISSGFEHFLEWKDTTPVPMEQVAQELDKDRLTSQETLIAGMLRPAHLLDLIRHFMLFMEADGRTIKIVARYQQFRATHAAVHRLRTGETRLQDGEYDRRGGIVWATQGSGKSLTMVFLVRKMRTSPDLRRFKVVCVTDRKTLQRQLARTAALTGETVRVGRTTRQVQELLAGPGPSLVFAMIQKYQVRDEDAPDDVAWGHGFADDMAREIHRPSVVEEFPVLNESEDILVMVDEAHRSHASELHANLMKALPNCARIGFTGTPIIMGARKRTHEIFGEYLDRYTIKQSELDGSTVPILYEGRTAEGAVADGRDLDEVFEDFFRDRSPAELEAIRKRYATTGHVMEAPSLIQAKARDMLRHYVDCILPNRFKAQVVAVSRRAAVRYQAAFELARDELVAEIEDLSPDLLLLDDTELAQQPTRTQFLVRARRHLDMIRSLQFAAIISAGTNDIPAWATWTDQGKQEIRIARFKRRLAASETDKTDPLAFLIVKSMLLTGFDAPVEQVMYLDRPIREHELLQAIARVNRTGNGKAAGLVVDYYGVANHLQDALKVYASEDVEGVMVSIRDELPKLVDRHRRVLLLFAERGIEDIDEIEECVRLLVDERLRAEFTVKLKQFLSTLDVVLPRPEALPFVADARTLGYIQSVARNRYRDEQMHIGGVGQKVRALIDRHVVSLGVYPEIPLTEITSVRFREEVAKYTSDRSKASEMEHALRYTIRKHMDEDPVFYQKLSERLEHILKEYKDHWTQVVMELHGLIDEAEAGRQRDETGLDPETEAPFFDVLSDVSGRDRYPLETDQEKLQIMTIELVDRIRTEIGLVDFWRNAQAQESLRKQIVRYLDDSDIIDFHLIEELADRLLDLARHNRHRLAP